MKPFLMKFWLILLLMGLGNAPIALGHPVRDFKINPWWGKEGHQDQYILNRTKKLGPFVHWNEE